MRSLGYLGAFFGGAIAGAVIGLLLAPEKGEDTRVRITDAVDDFMKKHNIKLSRKIFLGGQKSNKNFLV